MANSIISRGLPGMPGANIPQSPMVPYAQPTIQQPQMQPQANNPLDMINSIRQFASQVRGNPQQLVMNMIQNGQRTNSDLQRAMQIARQITGSGMLK